VLRSVGLQPTDAKPDPAFLKRFCGCHKSGEVPSGLESGPFFDSNRAPGTPQIGEMRNHGSPRRGFGNYDPGNGEIEDRPTLTNGTGSGFVTGTERRREPAACEDHRHAQEVIASALSVERADRTAGLGIPDDPRQTRVGKFLRRTTFDELPQLINVLKGEMSLIGPRPERTYYVERFNELVPKYLDRQRVKTGITGWAQVNGFRGDSSLEERIKYDIYYIENWSMAFDLKILVRTIGAVVSGK